MDTTLQVAIISCAFVIFSTILAGLFLCYQLRHERFRWAEQLKQTYATELLRVRLEEYPKLGTLLMNLGRLYGKQLSAEETHKLAREINTWASGWGGLYAQADTRSAVFIFLRN